MKYFEDLETGVRVRFGSVEMTREDVLEFARRYDPQPFHLDDAEAAKSHFGRLSASGWHTASATMRMLVDHWQASGLQEAGLGSLGLEEIHWPRPVHPGDILRGECEILSKRVSKSRPEMGIARTIVETFNQNDELVMSFVSNGLFRTRAYHEAS